MNIKKLMIIVYRDKETETKHNMMRMKKIKIAKEKGLKGRSEFDKRKREIIINLFCGGSRHSNECESVGRYEERIVRDLQISTSQQHFQKICVSVGKMIQ
jgi:hypothetical protein